MFFFMPFYQISTKYYYLINPNNWCIYFWIKSKPCVKGMALS